MSPLNRRSFLAASAATLPALAAAGAADKPGEKVTLAVLGVNGRGRGLLREFSAFKDVEIAYVCDPDERVIPRALKALDARHKRAPRAVVDLRDVLKDKSVDAVVVATPDHWHALATV